MLSGISCRRVAVAITVTLGISTAQALPISGATPLLGPLRLGARAASATPPAPDGSTFGPPARLTHRFVAGDVVLSSSFGALQEFEPTYGVQVGQLGGAQAPDTIGYEPSGVLDVSDVGTGSVLRMSPGGHVIGRINADFSGGVSAISYAPNGVGYIATTRNSQAVVYRVDSQGAVSELPNFGLPAGRPIAVGSDGCTLHSIEIGVVDPQAADPQQLLKVARYNACTNQTLAEWAFPGAAFQSWWNSHYGLVVSPDGSVVAATPTKLYRLTAAASVLLADADDVSGYGGGVFFHDVALDPVTGSIWAEQEPSSPWCAGNGYLSGQVPYSQAVHLSPTGTRLGEVATVGSCYTINGIAVAPPVVGGTNPPLTVIPPATHAGIDLTPNVPAPIVNTAQTFVAHVTDDNGPVVGQSVTFAVVSGPNDGKTGSTITNSAGVATFEYTSKKVGTDALIVTYSGSTSPVSNRADVYWNTGEVVAEQAVGSPPGKPGGCKSTTGAPVGHSPDPVNTALGAFVDVAVDFDLPGAGVTCGFSRAYISSDTTDGPLGVGWTHRYNASLTFAANGDATFRAEDGQRVVFTKQTDGTFVAAAGAGAQLGATSGGFLLTTRSQRTVSFDAAGKLTAMKDRAGIGLDFGYASGQLATITDAAGRVVTLTYAGALLDRATLPDGRYTGYGYSGGHLISVRDLRGKTTTYAYDAAGRLESETDPLGHRKYLNSYDAAGRVVEQVDPLGKITTFAWDAATSTARRTDPRGGVWTDVYSNNVLLAQSDPLGHTVRYGYDSNLNRVAEVDPNGNTTTMTYDGRGNMLTRTAPAPLWNAESWTYNADNQVLTHTDGRGVVVTANVYSSSTGRLTSSTDGEGGATSFTYTSNGQVASVADPRGKVTSFGYDADGNRTSVTSPLAEKTTMSYDPSGRLLYAVDPRGNVTGANPTNFKTAFAYDAGNLLTSTTDARGKVTALSYDDAGLHTSTTDALSHATTVGYDAANRPTSVTDSAGAVTSTSYDDTGNVLSVTTPAGMTTYSYDLAGRMTNRVDPRGNVTGADPSDYTWTFGRDDNGNVTSTSHPTAGTTSTEYDSLNRPTSHSDALGRTRSTMFDEANNVLWSTDPLARTVSFSHDKNNRLVEQTDPVGKKTTYGYDAAGNRTSMTTPLGEKATWTFDPDGRPATVVDPRGNVSGATQATYRTSFGYDVAGQRTSVTDPLGHAASSAFDAVGNLITKTDANSHAIGYTYDAVGRLASVTGADGAVTGYAYDAVGNLTSRTDAKGHVSAYSYDGAHRMTQLLTPIGQKWTFAYDADGNRIRTVTAAGNATAATGDGQITATFDPLGRQTGIDYSDSTPDVQFGYDQLRRTSMTDGAGTETYDYDNADQMTGVTRGESGFAYEYDANGQVAKRTYPDGTAVDIGHDDDGRMSSVTSAGTATSYSYDAAGNLITTTLPAGNGYVESRSVDAAGRLTQLANTKAGAVLSQFAVARDAVGNPLSVTSTRGTTSSVEAYSYDSADRLTKVCYAPSCAGAASSIGYSYDPVGNRTSETRLAASRPAALSVGAISSVGSPGMCATSQSAGNSAVTLTACSGAASQQWTRAEDGTLQIGTMCLELPWQVTASGTGTRINPCQGTASHQRWTARDDGTLVSATSGRCLTTNGGAGSTLVVADCAAAAGMRWAVPAGPGRPATGQAWNLAAPKMCASLYGGGNAPGSTVVYLECNGQTSKQWTAGADGTVRALGVCMDVPAGQTASGSYVRVYPCDGSAHQRWTARPDGQLAHDVSGRCLTVNPASASMILGDCTAAAGQVFSWPVVQTTTAYAYNTADQLTAATTDGVATGFGYDADGNQTLAGGVTSTFDLANRTATSTSATTTTAYTYDGAGKRLTAATNGNVDTRYSWDPDNSLPQLAEETDSAGGLIRRYVNGIDGPLSMTSVSGTSYYHHDAYGSISDVTSASGAAQWQYAYEPFGANRSTTKVDPGAPANPMQYTGQYQDPGGMYHLRARQYDPSFGRFTATDPLAPAISDPYVSSYAYAGSRPTLFGDPSGLKLKEFGSVEAYRAALEASSNDPIVSMCEDGNGQRYTERASGAWGVTTKDERDLEDEQIALSYEQYLGIASDIAWVEREQYIDALRADAARDIAQYWRDARFSPVPDYVSADLGWCGGLCKGGVLTVTRSGNVYFGLQAGTGVQLSGSVRGGYMDGTNGKGDTAADKFISGWSATAAVTAPIGGVGGPSLAKSVNKSGSAGEFGLGLGGGLSGTVARSKTLFKLPWSW